MFQTTNIKPVVFSKW